jgi:hypothetical protein
MIFNQNFKKEFFSLVNRGFTDAVYIVTKIIEEILNENFTVHCTFLLEAPNTQKSEKDEIRELVKLYSRDLIGLYDLLVSKYEEKTESIITAPRGRRSLHNAFIIRSMWQFDIINFSIDITFRGIEIVNLIYTSSILLDPKLKHMDLSFVLHPFEKFDYFDVDELDEDYLMLENIKAYIKHYSPYLIDLALLRLLNICEPYNNQTATFNNSLLSFILSENRSETDFNATFSNYGSDIPYMVLDFNDILDEFPQSDNSEKRFEFSNFCPKKSITRINFISQLQIKLAERLGAKYIQPESNTLEVVVAQSMRSRRPCIISGYHLGSSECIIMGTRISVQIQLKMIKMSICKKEFVL